MRYFSAVVVSLSIVLSSPVLGRPDTFFADSHLYNNAHLVHEFVDDQIRFRLTGPILNFQLSNQLFDYEKLKSYVKNRHRFPSEALRAAIINSLNMSFTTSFTAEEFLAELVKVLTFFLIASTR